ncbi:MAG: hypothetical protein QM783_10295 [Phycisphaerales bacterium]
MIADASLSNAFDDLADLFLGGPVPPKGEHPQQGAEATATSVETALASSAPQVRAAKPLAVEGLVLGHLPMMGSLWANQYVRMAAAAENGPVALVRLDLGSARVELFNPPHHDTHASRLDPRARTEHALAERQLSDLASALHRAARVASRIIVFSSLPADELLLARCDAVRSMALLTGADDASAVGAYKAVKRLGTSESASSPARSLLFRIAVMGSDEQKATAAFHRLADAARSFLALPIEFAGHCRQIAGGVPGTLLFEGPSAMTTQAALEALSAVEPSPPETRPSSGAPTPLPQVAPLAMHTNGHILSVHQPITGAASPVAAAPVIELPRQSLPTIEPMAATLPAGMAALPVRCPFDRDPILAIDAAGHPQIIAAASAGESSTATQRLLAVGAWFWASRELLSMVCPALRTDTKPVLHLVTDRPTDVNRLIDSDLRLHLRIPPAAVTGTLPLN